jgi:hypothetical protein
MHQKAREEEALEDKLFKYLNGIGNNYNQMLGRLKGVVSKKDQRATLRSFQLIAKI